MATIVLLSCCSCLGGSSTANFFRRRPFISQQGYCPGLLPPASSSSISCQTHDVAFRSPELSLSSSTAVFSLPFDISPPPIDHDLLDTMVIEGAKVSEDGIIETFHNDDEALDAVENGVAVVDLSHYGRIRGRVHRWFDVLCHRANYSSSPLLKAAVVGEDRFQFLHNQSTANFESIREGQGCDTVFVTPTARTIDIAHAWIMKNAITMVVSPETRGSIIEMLRKYIFFSDKVEIHDITKKTCFFVLVGPNSNQVMKDLNLSDLVGQAYASHKHYTVGGMPITVAVGNLISDEGFSFLISPAIAGSVWKALLDQGATPMGSNAWETLRILRGRPAPGKELTNEFNVLEAGLWNAISLNKGCYKGQETISRLVTYNGVKQKLWGICLSSPAEPGSSITVDGKKVGKLTSFTIGRKVSEYYGLGYIKRQAASAGDAVTVGDNVVGTVVEVPFLAGQHVPMKS